MEAGTEQICGDTIGGIERGGESPLSRPTDLGTTLSPVAPGAQPARLVGPAQLAVVPAAQRRRSGDMRPSDVIPRQVIPRDVSLVMQAVHNWQIWPTSCKIVGHALRAPETGGGGKRTLSSRFGRAKPYMTYVMWGGWLLRVKNLWETRRRRRRGGAKSRGTRGTTRTTRRRGRGLFRRLLCRKL